MSGLEEMAYLLVMLLLFLWITTIFGVLQSISILKKERYKITNSTYGYHLSKYEFNQWLEEYKLNIKAPSYWNQLFIPRWLFKKLDNIKPL